MKEDNIKRASLEEILAMPKLVQSENSEPNKNYDDCQLPDDFWDKAVVVYPENKTSIHLRIDKKVLDFFKAQGKGHLTRMNAVLRSYVEANEKKAG